MKLGLRSYLKRLVIGKKQPPWAAAAKDALHRGVVYKKITMDGYSLATYEKNGALDYEAYRKIQEIGNRAKIDNVFTTEELIETVSSHARQRLGVVSSILCHGTRNGMEQRWFKYRFPEAEILGTEISETAAQFPMTI